MGTGQGYGSVSKPEVDEVNIALNENGRYIQAAVMQNNVKGKEEKKLY